MGAIRSGVTVAIGLVATVVTVDSGVQREEPLRNVCVGQPDGDANREHDPAPTTAPAQCPHCGPIVDQSRVMKARKVGDGYQLVDAADVEQVRAEHADPFKLSTTFTPHPRDQVDTLTRAGEKVYYLRPSAAHANYATLREMIRRNPEYGFVGLYTPRTRAGLFTLDVRGDVLVMVERIPQSKARPLPEIDPVEPGRELELAVAMVAQIADDFTDSTYDDGYAAAVAELFADRDTVTVGATGQPARAGVAQGEELAARLEQLVAKKPTRKRAPARKKPAADVGEAA